MSMPAGWYDDGSGRQRWWDGARWTDDFAPAQAGAGAQSAPPAHMAAPVTSASSERVAPVLGFIGLGLAVLGTILAFIPAVFGVGVVVLLAGFVVSLIGLFRKGAAKWPSIVGMVLAVVGGIIGTIVFLVALVAGLPGPVDPIVPTDAPSSSTSDPSDPPATEAAQERPSAELLSETILADLQRSGMHQYDDDPEWIACWGQYVYDSELSDDALNEYVETMDVLGDERDLMKTVSSDATVFCSSQ